MVRKARCSQNVYHLTLLFLLLFKLIGLATFSISKRRAAEKKPWGDELLVTGSKVEMFYNLLFSCSIMASTYITIPTLYTDEYPYKGTISTTIDISEGILGSFVMFSVSLYYCMYQLALIKIGNRLIQAEATLRRLQRPTNRKHIFCVLLVCSFMIVLCISVWVTEYLSYYNGPPTWVTTIFPNTFVGLLFIQYFSVLTLTGAFFANLNSIIQDLDGNWSDVARLDLLYQTRRLFGSSMIRLLLQTREIHCNLCDISSQISQFYSLPTLICVFFSFCTLLNMSYYLLDLIIIGDALKYIIYVNISLWIIYILYPIGLLTSKITEVVNEVEKTGRIVHLLLNRTIDREVKNELERFSLQLLHQRVKFTANGFFTLDNTFLQSMLGTTTTYLVVLIQFRQGTAATNDQPCNCTQW
ncbi:putative gustatory receptor 28a [Xylocopa sonorina]|uniref:putative gustatory receptor 28a n=1 Tax=Xylocopa sonorina TaxID=1818115 RepID=UPI00403A8BCA